MTTAQQEMIERIAIRDEILTKWEKLYQDTELDGVVVLMLADDWATIEKDGTTHWSSLSRRTVLSS